MHIHFDFHISCEIELWETHAISMFNIPRENQFRRKRTALTAAPFHLICSTFLAESEIEKRMHDAQDGFACFSILHFSREI